jgi:MFS transporter, DHA1 family, inner membrane transport protein
MRGSAVAGLATLALCAFVVGTCELVVVGLLDRIASSMTVSISTVGQLVTAYALGIGLGGPVLAVATARIGRRRLLFWLLAAFLTGNAVTAAATGYGMLLVARIATGAVQGLFIGAASVVAAGLVPARRRGQAMSMVFGGIAVSTVLGVPLGTLLGQAWGWRAVFAAITALGAVALACALTFLPAVAEPAPARFRAQARAGFTRPVLAMLGVGLVLMGGQFTAFTYLAPYLTGVTGIPAGAVSGFLLIYGVASAAGTFAGGRLADRSAATVLAAGNVLLVLALGAVYLAGATPVLVAVALAGWGLAGFGLVPALQLRIVSLAGSGGDLAATLGASAVNLGIALGAFLGGRVTAGPGVHAVALAATIIVAAALPVTWATRRLQPAPVPANPAEPAAEPVAPDLAAACHAACLVQAGKAAASMMRKPDREPAMTPTSTPGAVR